MAQNTQTPKKPVGDSPKWLFMRWVWDLLAGGRFPLRGVRTSRGEIDVQWVDNAYELRIKSVASSDSDVLYLPVCKRDGTEKYIAVRVESTTEFAEEDIPAGANIYDPTP